MARLLVVDDEQDIRLLYAAELEEEGYEVETAGTAVQARSLLQQHPFDLVVLDIQIGNESGLHLLQEIVRDNNKLPIVLCTAYSCYKDDLSSWLADAYVVKNSDLSELKSEVHRLLSHPAL